MSVGVSPEWVLGRVLCGTSATDVTSRALYLNKIS